METDEYIEFLELAIENYQDEKIEDAYYRSNTKLSYDKFKEQALNKLSAKSKGIDYDEQARLERLNRM